MSNLDKIVRIGTLKTYGGRSYSIYCHIKYIDGKLSITGVEGPLPSGNAIGSCGQIIISYKEYDNRGHDLIYDIHPAPNWNHAKIRQLFDIWHKWHLNDMQAGTPAQMEYLEDRRADYPGFPTDYYTWASEQLRLVELNPDNGYCYGSAWLTMAVPDDVIDWLRQLPDTDRKPAWV